MPGSETTDDACPFCLGRSAAHRGVSDAENPYPAVDVSPGTVDWYETDYGLWKAGHSVGSSEPGGVLWYEQDKDARE